MNNYVGVAYHGSSSSRVTEIAKCWVTIARPRWHTRRGAKVRSHSVMRRSTEVFEQASTYVTASTSDDNALCVNHSMLPLVGNGGSLALLSIYLCWVVWHGRTIGDE